MTERSLAVFRSIRRGCICTRSRGKEKKQRDENKDMKTGLETKTANNRRNDRA